jgi:hypothetical protein
MAAVRRDDVGRIVPCREAAGYLNGPNMRQRRPARAPDASRITTTTGAQLPNSSLSVRAVVSIDSALARSSALFFGLEKPCPVPL